ncbi:unnamed protein product [Lathyrus oleraceus]
MNLYPHLAFVYFNGVKSPLKFRICENIFLVDLKIKLNTFLRYLKNRRVVELEYRSPAIDNEGNIQFTMLELKTDDDLKVMWSAFYRYSTKGLIEVDVTIQRSVEDIIRMLQRPEQHIFNNM